MSPDDIAERLAALQRHPRPSVHRFDAGEPLRGPVGVLSSSFNPPTRAHLRLLGLAREVDHLQRSAVLLSTRNVDKGLFGAPFEHRIGMLLALRGVESTTAVLAANVARIRDQAEALQQAHPDAEFWFILGYDTLVRLFDPRYYDNMHGELAPFFERHGVVAANRGEATVEHVQHFLHEPEVRPFVSRILVREIEPEPAAMSSTAERAAIARGRPTPGIPEPVRHYIRRHNLYREDRPGEL